MKVTRFNHKRDLVIVRAWLWGPRGDKQVWLAVDTASAETVVTPDTVDLLGYNPRDGETITTVRSAIGKEQGWTLRVSRFSTLGFVVPNYRIHVFDLATGHDIDGLIGLTFLRQFNCEFRFTEGRIRAERAAVESG